MRNAVRPVGCFISTHLSWGDEDLVSMMCRLKGWQGPIGIGFAPRFLSRLCKSHHNGESRCVLGTELSIFVVSANERLQSVLARLLERHPILHYADGSPNAREALDRVGRVRPDLLVSDSPPANVHEVLIWREIRGYGPRLLMLTNYVHEHDVFLSILAGASGLILAPAGRSRALLDSILRVAQGGSLIPERLITRLHGIAIGEEPSRLDEAERRVLRLITEGRRDQEIATEEAATLGQVRSWVASIAERLP